MCWVSQINNFYKLLIILTFELIPEIEKLSVETVKNGLAYVLGNSYNVTEIGKIVISKWYTNKNFGGVYSFTKQDFIKRVFHIKKN